jgi:hypothetical protein
MIVELALILQLIVAHPIVYQGPLKHRPAIVHYSGTHFFIVYMKKHPWGDYPVEIIEVDSKTFVEERLYISEEIRT